MTLELWITLFASTAVSGVVPLVNAEVLVVAAGAAIPGARLPLVAVVAAAGQMSTKTMLYGLARWAPSRLPDKATGQLDRMCESLTRHDAYAGLVVFVSGAVGIPPFYGVSIAAGVLRIRIPTFVLLGFFGRALRFGVLVWAASEAGEALRQASPLLPLFGIG